MSLTDLKATDLHNPTLVKAYSLYMDISFIITTTCYMFMLYIICTKSNKSMQTYKYLILNQLSWSYFVEFTFSFLQPIVLMPFLIWYSAGLSQYFGPNVVFYMVYVLVMAATGFVHSIYFSLLFRLVMIKGESRFHKLFKSTKWLVSTHLITLIPMLIVALGKLNDV